VGNIGIPELIFIFVLALLIFGPRKLPELGRTLGKALGEFRKASTELRVAMEEEMRELERQGREIETQAQAQGTVQPAEGALPRGEEPVGSGTIAPPEPVGTASESSHAEETASHGEPKPA